MEDLERYDDHQALERAFLIERPNEAQSQKSEAKILVSNQKSQQQISENARHSSPQVIGTQEIKLFPLLSEFFPGPGPLPLPPSVWSFYII